MSDVEREACFSCGRLVALEAEICPNCRQRVLVDVGLEQPVADGRQRYRLARSLTALGAPVPSVPVLQQALTAPQPVVARSVTRALAARLAEVLRAESLVEAIEPSGKSGSFAAALAGSRVVAWGLGLVLVLGLLGGVWFALVYQPDAERRAAASEPEARALVLPISETPSSVSSLTTSEIASRWLSSTVVLRCGTSVGSGFFVTPDTILTNTRVLCAPGEELTVVMADKREAPGLPGRRDNESELALVRVSDLTGVPIPLGDAGEVAVGEKVVLMGAPAGLEFSVHEGTVSSVSRVVEGVACLQLDGKVNPGNSGGPLLDRYGRVIGVLTMKGTSAEGIGYAIAVNYAYRAHPALVQPGPGIDGMGFDRMLNRARIEGSEESEEGSGVEGPLPLPMLVGVQDLGSRDGLQVRVVLPGPEKPRARELSFRLLDYAEAFCSLDGIVFGWDPYLEGASMLDLDAALLSRRTRFGGLFVGEAQLIWLTCPRERIRPGIVLELVGADPEFARLRVDM